MRKDPGSTTGDQKIENDYLAAFIVNCGGAGRTAYCLQAVDLKTAQGSQRILEGTGGEFTTSFGSVYATRCETQRTADGGWEVRLSGQGEGWEASEIITLPPGRAELRRQQTYRFLKACEGAICPGFQIKADAAIRYTFALRAHEQSLANLPSMRSAVDWALPFPFHVWHNDRYVALYGVDRSSSPGTLDFVPVADGAATLRVYYPDRAPLEGKIFQASGQGDEVVIHHVELPSIPGLAHFAAGEEVTLTEVFAIKALKAGEEPLLEAERMSAEILLSAPPRQTNFEKVAEGIADFFKHCELWEPDALGEGRGWFSNMWVRTQSGPAKKKGEMSGYFDLGWGEGVAVEIWMGVVRYWKRTGDKELLSYVDEMTRNMELFRRGNEPNAPYYDRSDGRKYGDFLMDLVSGDRIWTHSLGHTGSQLIQLYQVAPDYPDAETREHWLRAATSIGLFFAKHQKADGDLQDVFDENDREVNTKPHRITARAVVCGLWTRLGQVTGDKSWIERAMRLAHAVAPEINRYEYFNQMVDGIYFPELEYTDSEGAMYVLEGLAPLYAQTRDPEVLVLCRKTAAFGFAWTYFYDLPLANNGVARGGQCCRMNDTPLLYPIAPAKSMEPLLSLAESTGDLFYEKMAGEAAAFIGNWQMKAPGQPWDGGMIHAMGQFSGKHWGPDLAGAVDTGMATGNSLAAIEIWLAHAHKP